MAFLYKAFIRKNTPELRKKLEELGYNRYPRWMADWDDDDSRYKYLVTDELYYTYPQEPSKPKEGEYINCGDNEELFLAIAALRDDTDYMQWFMIPNTKTVSIPGYCGQQGMNGYQRIVTSVEYHMHDRKDNRISDLINFEKEDGETILPRKLNIDELKLWFNHKIMHNPYKDDSNIKYYTNNIRE